MGCDLLAFHGRFGNRIEAVPPPGVTTANAFDSQPAASKDAMGFNGLKKIVRARRLVTAPGTGTGKNGKHRRDENLVSTNAEPDKNHALKMPARWQARNQSCWSWSKEAFTAEGRAMITSCTPGLSSGRLLRANSRSRRRTWLRTTAPPSRREVTSPILAG